MLKKTRIAIAVILFACAALLAVFAVVGSSSFQDCVAEARQQKSTEQQEEGAAYLFRPAAIAAHRIWRCTGHFIDQNQGAITATFTVILGVATILLWYATSGLVRGAELTAEGQLRAYVFVASAEIADRGKIPKAKRNKALDGYLMSFVAIRNAGQTPAYDVVHWGELEVCKVTDEHTLVIPKLSKISASTIPPGGINNKTRWRAAKLADDEIEAIKAGTKAIYVYGRIEYTDAFKKRRFTNYRLAYAGIYPPPAGVTLTFCNEGNETDEHDSVS